MRMSIVAKHRLFVVLVSLAIGVLAVATFWKSQNPKDDERMTFASAVDIKNRIRLEERPLTLVNLWATWCEPCKHEIPDLVSLQKKWGARGLGVFLVSMDETDQLTAAKNFLSDQGVKFQTFMRAGEVELFMQDLLPQWNGAIPLTVFFDSQGKVVDFWSGSADFAKFDAFVSDKLAK
ncbi:MAG: TlpA family protein disulfide reductase [Oligoflexia bacterium]|nr:TlpA family protein disulfide reductase [Oligoflexia bacterium]